MDRPVPVTHTLYDLKQVLKDSNLWVGRLLLTSDRRFFYTDFRGCVYVSSIAQPLTSSCTGVFVQPCDEGFELTYNPTCEKIIMHKLSDIERTLLMMFS